jgi:hypothetical protein
MSEPLRRLGACLAGLLLAGAAGAAGAVEVNLRPATDGAGIGTETRIRLTLVDADARPIQAASTVTGAPVVVRKDLTLAGTAGPQAVDLAPQSTLARPDAEATYYQAEITAAGVRQRWTFQVPDSPGPHEIPTLAAGSAIAPGSLLADHLLSGDERAALDGASDPSASNPLATMDDVTAGVSGVSSWAGRTGAVTPAAGDYAASLVGVVATPINYTPDDASVEGHLAGVDDALATAGGGHDPVTLAGAYNYLTLADQQITRGAIDLGTDTTGTLAVASGGTGAATAAGARASLGVDPAGTDNSTAVTLAGAYDYLTLSGQEITRGAIDLGTDTSGTLAVASGGTGAATAAGARAALDVDQAGTDNSTAVTLAGTYDYLTLSGQELTRGPVDLGTDTTGTLAIARGGTGQTSLGAIDAADLGSGTAAAGYVLTADGAGSAAYEAPTGGGSSGFPLGHIWFSGRPLVRSDSDTIAVSAGEATIGGVEVAWSSQTVDITSGVSPATQEQLAHVCLDEAGGSLNAVVLTASDPTWSETYHQWQCADASQRWIGAVPIYLDGSTYRLGGWSSSLRADHISVLYHSVAGTTGVFDRGDLWAVAAGSAAIPTALTLPYCPDPADSYVLFAALYSNTPQTGGTIAVAPAAWQTSGTHWERDADYSARFEASTTNVHTVYFGRYARLPVTTAKTTVYAVEGAMLGFVGIWGYDAPLNHQ